MSNVNYLKIVLVPTHYNNSFLKYSKKYNNRL